VISLLWLTLQYSNSHGVTEISTANLQARAVAQSSKNCLYEYKHGCGNASATNLGHYKVSRQQCDGRTSDTNVIYGRNTTEGNCS
jgi:hypothetical protein